MTDAAALIADARAALVRAAAPRERLGTLVVPRRVLGIGRAPRIRPAGDAWNLGVLLIGDDAVYATGTILRAREEVRRGFTAESQRARAELAAAAFRGGFAEGATVHIEWRQLDLAALAAGDPQAPLLTRDGRVWVRWSPAGAPRPLADYLADRVALLAGD